jgi:hypothetical protein
MSDSLRRRQRRMLFVLAAALVAGGLVVLLLLDRIPLPLRLLIGFGDVIAGSVLLVVLRQKFPRRPETPPGP